MLFQFRLIEAIRVYIPNFDEELLDRVYQFSRNAHEEQKRASGESYFSHPVAVALIAANMRLDLSSILAALLHDTLEDTYVTIEAIHALFGAEIAKLVDGVTKIGKVHFSSREKYKAENFRRFIEATTGDIRVLLIKLCDRLHNMRTLYHIPNTQKRREIALETLEIFSVFASRMGLQAIQNEFEELAFAELHQEEHQRITRQIEEFYAKDAEVVDRIVREFSTIFREVNMFPHIVGRNKTPYSIWNKLQKRHIPFEQLTDIVAFRVILPDIESCYRALGVLHTRFQAVPARFKDYISTPKPNGYRSIHTTILGSFHRPIEVQIRTVDMNNMAHNGRCAHWVYKKDPMGRIGTEQYRWLKSILEIFQNTTVPEEILSSARSEMSSECIFCFTPRGDPISLPEKATPVDFAYAVHTHIGNSCVGARVDGRITPLSTILQSGSHVEILTDDHQTPSALWMNSVVTGKAKTCIGKYIRTREKTEFTLLGQSLLQQQLAHLQEGFSRKDVIQQLSKWFGCTTQRGLQESIGRGRILLPHLHHKICHMGIPLKPSIEPEPIDVSDFALGIAVHHADCCNPIVQDRIVGEIVSERGLVIHTRTCDQAHSEQNVGLEIFWGGDAPSNTRVHIQLRIVVLNQPGSFAMVFNILRDNEVRISNIKTTYRTLEFLDAIAEIEIENEERLMEIIASLQTCSRVHKVEEVK